MIATETIIVTPPPIRLAAAGAMLLSLALPVQATERAPRHHAERSTCDGAQPCDQSKQSAPRRRPLKASVKRECTRLDAAIRDNEETEQRAGARGVMESLQQDAQSLRKRYRELGC
jgi:hypothetical protein